MIQRIQSIYLAVAAIAASIVASLNVGTFIKDDRQYVYDLWTITENIPQGTQITQVFYIGLMAIAIALLSLICLLLYVIPEYTIGSEVTFNPWMSISLLPLIMTWFAYKSIRKDEAKVKAADRLR